MSGSNLTFILISILTMAHVRRGRMGLGTHNVLNTAAAGKAVTATKNGSVVDLKRNVLGGGIAKRIVTRAALKTGLIL